MHRIATALLVAHLAACVGDVGAGKVKADVAEPPKSAAAVETPAKGTAFAVDTSKSKIRALSAKITATHPIDFPDFKGKVQWHEGEPTAVGFEVTMETLVSDHPKLTGHLKNEDFFDVSKYPTSTFTSASIAKGAKEEGFTHTVTGDFRIHGVTKRLTFPAKFEEKADAIMASTEFVINRQDFKITYPGRPDDLVQDNVRLTIEFVAPKT